MNGISWLTALAAIATLQWLVVAGLSAFSRSRFPRNGTMRRSEKLLLASSALLAGGWLAQLDYASLWKAKSPAVAASAAAKSTGSCASISAGMTAAEVKSRLGEPDEVRANDEIRGPGAKTLVYKGSRCAVHLFDDRVDHIE